jgi:GNAT superfamily N-acetyltransferase
LHADRNLCVGLLDPSKRLDFSAQACFPVVGVSMVSFDAHTREKSLTCNPPDDQPFLSNMGVAPAFRGKGIASELLLSCEDIARDRVAPCKMYLLARQRDSPAISLYRCVLAPNSASSSICTWWMHTVPPLMFHTL